MKTLKINTATRFVLATAMASLLPALAGQNAAMAQAAASSTPAATNSARNAPSVTVTEIERREIVDTVIVTGTLVAREEILIANQIEGFAISEILVEEGDSVKADQVLARLSRETLDAMLAQNTAQIARADANMAAARSAIIDAEAARVFAQASLQRTKSLKTDGFASIETFDQRQAAAQQSVARVTSAREQLRQAEAEKALAQAQRREMEIRLARTEIRAPADGIISRRTARVGAIATAAGEPMFRMIKDGAIELEADIAETTLARMAIGQPVNVTPAGHDTAIPGKVRLISAEIGRTTRLGKVRLVLDQPGNQKPTRQLIIGSFARGIIEIARKNAVVTPLSAVLFTAEGPRVQVVKDGIVQTRTIKTGIRTGTTIEAVSGIEPGETVVTISGTFLRQGDRVTPVKAQ